MPDNTEHKKSHLAELTAIQLKATLPARPVAPQYLLAGLLGISALVLTAASELSLSPKLFLLLLQICLSVCAFVNAHRARLEESDAIATARTAQTILGADTHQATVRASRRKKTLLANKPRHDERPEEQE